MMLTDAFVSDWDCVRKSRFRSNPLPFARIPATRPSGFWITLKSTTELSRISSTTGSSPLGVVASVSIVRMFASTPSYSLPWIPPWMKSGTLTWPSDLLRVFWALAGFVSASRRTFFQLANALRWYFESRSLIVTRNMSRPVADGPITSMLIRPSLSA